MTALIIIAAILLFLALLIILPVSVRLIYDNDFSLKAYYAGIKVFDTVKPEGDKHIMQKKKKEDNKEKQEEEKKKQFFLARDYEKMDKLQFIKYYAAVAKDVFSKLLYLVKKLKIKLLDVTVGVATADAYDTAVQYGAVCAALDPVFSLLNTYTKIRTKRINIYSDFVARDYRIAADVKVSISVIYLLVSAVRLYKIYKALDDGTYVIKQKQPENDPAVKNSKDNTDKVSVNSDERTE